MAKAQEYVQNSEDHGCAIFFEVKGCIWDGGSLIGKKKKVHYLTRRMELKIKGKIGGMGEEDKLLLVCRIKLQMQKKLVIRGNDL